MKKIIILLLLTSLILNAGWATKIIKVSFLAGVGFTSMHLLNNFIKKVKANKNSIMSIFEDELNKSPKEKGCLQLYQYKLSHDTVIGAVTRNNDRDARIEKDVEDFAYGTEREINLTQYDNVKTYPFADDVKKLLVSFMIEDPNAKNYINNIKK